MTKNTLRTAGALLLALAAAGCSAQKTIRRKMAGGADEFVVVDEGQARQNRILWLIDNLEFQEKQVLARNLASLIHYGPEAVPALIEALDTRPPKIRANAAFALGEIADERAVGPLEQHLRLDTNLDVRRDCAQALLTFKKHQGVPLLIQTLRYAGDGTGEHSGLYGRYAAIKVLKHTFGQDLGFAPQAPEPQREEAVRRWESWWATNRARYPE